MWDVDKFARVRRRAGLGWFGAGREWGGFLRASAGAPDPACRRSRADPSSFQELSPRLVRMHVKFSLTTARFDRRRVLDGSEAVELGRV